MREKNSLSRLSLSSRSIRSFVSFVASRSTSFRILSRRPILLPVLPLSASNHAPIESRNAERVRAFYHCSKQSVGRVTQQNHTASFFPIALIVIPASFRSRTSKTLALNRHFRFNLCMKHNGTHIALRGQAMACMTAHPGGCPVLLRRLAGAFSPVHPDQRGHCAPRLDSPRRRRSGGLP
jgi:hypothetical protein